MKLSTLSALKPSHARSSTGFGHFLLGLQQFSKRLSQLIVGSQEVQVWQASDRAGNVYWRVYDPATKASTSFSSVNEVRVWLEQRYYQQP